MKKSIAFYYYIWRIASGEILFIFTTNAMKNNIFTHYNNCPTKKHVRQMFLDSDLSTQNKIIKEFIGKE